VCMMESGFDQTNCTTRLANLRDWAWGAVVSYANFVPLMPSFELHTVSAYAGRILDEDDPPLSDMIEMNEVEE
jgi:hypothetical protein